MTERLSRPEDPIRDLAIGVGGVVRQRVRLRGSREPRVGAANLSRCSGRRPFRFSLIYRYPHAMTRRPGDGAHADPKTRRAAPTRNSAPIAMADSSMSNLALWPAGADEPLGLGGADEGVAARRLLPEVGDVVRAGEGLPVHDAIGPDDVRGDRPRQGGRSAGSLMTAGVRNSFRTVAVQRRAEATPSTVRRRRRQQLLAQVGIETAKRPGHLHGVGDDVEGGTGLEHRDAEDGRLAGDASRGSPASGAP